MLTTMKHKYLYLSISVSGASVLAIEILGTRILGPFYGVSLFLWSALITVTLAALSAGYALGGRWADKGATYPRLSSLLAGAGLWLLAVPWIRNPILHLAEPFGLRFAALVTALALFFVPLMLLGMVSPYAIKLRTTSLDEIGRSAGNLYAISTVASVVAALLTGFFLIPSFGVYRLTLAVGILLIATALPGLFGKRLPAAKLILPIVILAAGAVFLRGFGENRTDPEHGLIFKGQSPYGEIRVVNDFEFRYLLIDGAVHTAVDTSFYYSTVMPYVNVVDIASGYFEKPGRLLLIGLGGGSVAKRYHRKGWDIDAVEIDPLVTKVAYDYFGFDSIEARVHQMDGRRFLLSSGGAYDIIVLDAFGSSSIPFHLASREAFALMTSRLSPDGVFVLNVQSIGWNGTIVRSLAATLGTQFPNVRALPTMEPPDKLGNVVLFASKRSLDLREEPPVPIDRLTAEYDRFHAWENRFEPDTRGIPVLTDDRNYVDLWAEAINIQDRKELHGMFAKAGVSW
ncbi:MAG: fused MFS/spermidine synthase [Candidatus Krumholzibacteriia bacterium]